MRCHSRQHLSCHVDRTTLIGPLSCITRSFAGSARLACPIVRATGGSPSSTGASREAPPASLRSRSDINSSLLSALASQFQRESLPWIQDLVEPLLQGPPAPLKDTQPPEQLADPDSRFVDVHGVRLHYRIRAPGGWAAPPSSSGGEGSAAVQGQGQEEVRAAGRSGPGSSASSSPNPSTASSPATSSASASASAAPTLLLMHGLNGSTFSWRLLLDDLATHVSPATGGCRVISYDRPPYGLSQRPLEWSSEEDNPYSLAGGARLASGLLDALAAAEGSGSGPPGRVVLVGHSAGASVAVETALRYPERVSGLVLIAPAISTAQGGFLARADLGQLLRFAWTRALLAADGPGLNYVRRQVLKRKAEVEAGQMGLYVDDRPVPQEVIDGYLLPLRAHDWDRGTLLVYRSLQVAGEPQALEQLRVPVLVLQGGRDKTVPLTTAEAVAAALRRRRGPGAVTELVVLEGCGHVPMDEQPLDVRDAMVDFINRHCSGSGSDRPGECPGAVQAGQEQQQGQEQWLELELEQEPGQQEPAVRTASAERMKSNELGGDMGVVAERV